MNILSSRVKRISASPTLELLKIKNSMIKKGETILDFGAGEPDFNTPDFIKKAGIEAINDNFTKYTAVTGIPTLKEAIAKSYFREQGYSPDASEIVVTPGSKYGLFLIIQSVIDRDDEVIVPKPYWVTYPQLVGYAGGKTVFADHMKSDDLFAITADSYIEKYSARTKAVIINSPSNPTGEIMNERELKEAVQFFTKKGILIIFDDCYRKIIYTDKPFVSPLTIYPESRETVAIVGSLSKTYSMTGWRLGFTIAPEYLCKAMSKIEGHSTSNPCSISQKAAIKALDEEDGSVSDMVKEYRKRRDLITGKINEIGNLKFKVPMGAFYFFIDFSYYIDSMGFKNDTDFAMDILNKLKIITVPGSAFGAEGYLRISYAASLEILEEGFEKLKKYLKG